MDPLLCERLKRWIERFPREAVEVAQQDFGSNVIRQDRVKLEGFPCTVCFDRELRHPSIGPIIDPIKQTVGLPEPNELHTSNKRARECTESDSRGRSLYDDDEQICATQRMNRGLKAGTAAGGSLGRVAQQQHGGQHREVDVGNLNGGGDPNMQGDGQRQPDESGSARARDPHE